MNRKLEEGLMKESKTLPLLIIIINVIGVICLIYYVIPYLIHDTTIVNPDTMLPAESWDRAGMILTFGFVPLLGANILSFLFVGTRQKFVRFLFFIPSAVCFGIAVSYWIKAALA